MGFAAQDRRSPALDNVSILVETTLPAATEVSTCTQSVEQLKVSMAAQVSQQDTQKLGVDQAAWQMLAGQAHSATFTCMQ